MSVLRIKLNRVFAQIAMLNVTYAVLAMPAMAQHKDLQSEASQMGTLGQHGPSPMDAVADGGATGGVDATGDILASALQLAPRATTADRQEKRRAEPDAARFKRFDSLGEPGLTTKFPGSADSVLRDAGGFRSKLAENDIGFQARLGINMSYNPLDTGQPRDPQRYIGQRFTVATQTFQAVTTFGLQRWGLPNSLISIGGMYKLTTFRPEKPNVVTLRNLYYYQSFLDKKIEMKVGIMAEFYDFVGFFTGGSPVLSSGISGLPPMQAGLTTDSMPTPALNLTFNFNKGHYLRLGEIRSVHPRGSSYEVRNNHHGTRLDMPGSGELTIAEYGVLRPASDTGRQIWLRAGGIYNNSDYRRFDGRGTSHNESYYALADRQVTQPDTGSPAHGLYLGASAFWARDQVSVFTRTLGVRAYQYGPFASRPRDSVSFRLEFNRFSAAGNLANKARGIFSNDNQVSATLSYSAHVANGVYVTPAVAYIRHPSYIGDFNDAANLSLTAYMLF